jgi:UDP-glucose 4-epimerase
MNKHTVLITGGAGYIGSHVGYACARAGYQVIVLDSFVHNNYFSPHWATVIKGDYGDAHLLQTIFSSYAIDAVIHCAGSIEVGESVRNPLAFYENNVSKTIVLLQQMIHRNVRNFIFSSSCAVYGQPHFIPLTEAHQLQPMSPYGHTKAMIEQLLQDVAHIHHLRFVALRYFNAAGAFPEEYLGEQHLHETHLIPLMLDALLMKKPFTIFGGDYNTKDGTAVRDFVHVRDIAHAHLLALEHLHAGYPSDCFNLGTGVGYSIKEIVEMMQRISGIALKTIVAPRRVGDPDVLIADSHKAQMILQWKPYYSDLEYILKSAFVFHKELMHKKEAYYSSATVI